MNQDSTNPPHADKGKYYLNKLLNHNNEDPVYNPKKRFDIHQVRTAEFQLAQRVVMAGVDYR